MSLSCFFDFVAEEKFEVNVWPFQTPGNASWVVKDMWMAEMDTPWIQDPSECSRVYFHEICLVSEEAGAYYAELSIYDTDPDSSREPIVKKLDLNVRSSVKIEFNLYKDSFNKDQDKLTLRCHINLFPLFHAGYVQPVKLLSDNTCFEMPIAKVSSAEALKNLSRDMKELLETGKFSDLTLVCGSTEIKVHKNIIAVRAPNLAWVFGIPVEEKFPGKNASACGTGQIKVKKVHTENIELELLLQLLSFIYTGKVTTEDRTLISNLRTLAVFYDMEELELTCNSLKARDNSGF